MLVETSFYKLFSRIGVSNEILALGTTKIDELDGETLLGLKLKAKLSLKELPPKGDYPARKIATLQLKDVVPMDDPDNEKLYEMFLHTQGVVKGFLTSAAPF